MKSASTAFAVPAGAWDDSVCLGSPAWKINSEIVLLLGWDAAILAQVAHPLVAAGVAEHSMFLVDPAGRPKRLRRTLDTMLALTFGTPTETLAAADRINAIHDRVNGRLGDGVGAFASGAVYSAHDPALLTWVHATVLDAFPRTYELFVGPLSSAEKDRYCADASMVAPLLGIPDNVLPTSMTDVRRYMDQMLTSGEIAVGATARTLAREIVCPSLPRLPKPLLWLAQLPTIGLLPPALRAAYGFTWDARRERALRVSAALTRRWLALAPTAARHWPAARRARNRIRRRREQ